MEGIIERTIEVLQPLIKKPKLTPKLLGKPPFRFLHDIVSEVTRSTGFAEGLYNADELNAGAIKDKDSKLGYLDKIHKYVSAAKGGEVPLKLGKVVAGMEPEKTNEFLQAMAEAATDGSVNRGACLAAVMGGDAGQDDGAEAEAAAASQAAADAQASAEAAAERQAAAEAEQAAMEQRRHAEEMQAQQEEASRQEEDMNRRAAEEDAGSGMPPPDMGAPPPAPPAPPPAQPQGGGVNFAEPEPGMDDGMPPPPQMDRRPLPARPTTARRPPPKLPSKEVKTVREKPNLPPGAPVPVASVVGLIAEGVDDDDEEEEEEQAAVPLPGWDLGEKDGDEVVEGEQHGALVADIMAQKQKMQKDGGEDAPAEDAPQEGIIIIKKDKRRGSLSSSQGKRAPKQSDNDIHKLRASIQQLCQSTTPLGKCIEGVQGDLEHMEREFRMWKAEGMANSRKLEHTTNNTEQHLAPLQAQVADEEQKIKDMQMQINRVKATIMQNNLTIHSLLRGVVAGHRN